jgi:hypothetical protein
VRVNDSHTTGNATTNQWVRDFYRLHLNLSWVAGLGGLRGLNGADFSWATHGLPHLPDLTALGRAIVAQEQARQRQLAALAIFAQGQRDYYNGQQTKGLGGAYANLLNQALRKYAGSPNTLSPLQASIVGLYNDRSGLTYDDPAGEAVIQTLSGGLAGLLKAGAEAGLARMLAGSVTAASGDIAASGLADAASSAGRSAGPYIVYTGERAGGQLYVGITRNYAARQIFHKTIGRVIEPLVQGLSYQEARGAEQLLIDYYGKGNLDNVINSIAFRNPKFQSMVTQGLYALQDAGQSPFG